MAQYDFLKEDEKELKALGVLLDNVCFSKLYRKKRNRWGTMTLVYETSFDHPKFEEMRTLFYHFYVERGYGIKSLVAHTKTKRGTYTSVRKVCQQLGFLRTGRSVVTPLLKEMRSQNVQGDKNPWYGWPESLRTKDRHHRHHLCGWFVGKDGTRHYLRSSYEYGYAKFLDDNDVEFTVEKKGFLLSDGRLYRPDFFIFEQGKLDRIVEVKSRYSNGQCERIDKFEMFQKEYPGLRSEILIDSDLWTLIGRTYSEVLTEWKKVRSENA